VADPKQLLEAALFSLLDTSLTWPVYNTFAIANSFAYVVFQAVGGEDDHMKKRGHEYEYQVVGIHTDRLTALQMSAAVEAALATARAAMSITGYGLIWAERVGPIDYTEELPDGVLVHHVGGTYQFMLREV
jgi:hypothetical protein